MGRKALPDEQKKLRGTAQKCRIKLDKPQPKVGLAICPDMVLSNEIAHKEWQRKSIELAEIGILGTTDEACLAAYCLCYARMQKAQQQIEDNGMVLETDKGYQYQNPYLAIYNKCVDQLVKLASEYGFTPASRQKISISSTKPENAFAALDDVISH